jgi:hypothetical protein
MRRGTAAIVLCLGALSIECAELHVDEGYVCFVPPNCPCADLDTCDWACEGGELPADASFEVVLSLGGACGESDFEDLECHVTQTGELELTIETSWRPAPSDRSCIYGEDAVICGGINFDCGETPPLAAGTWTVKFGATTQEFVVPNPETTNPFDQTPPNCFYDGAATEPE